MGSTDTPSLIVVQGKKVTYVQVSEDQHIANEKAAGFPERIGQELCQMYLFIEEFGCAYSSLPCHLLCNQESREGRLIS